jgi:hypothetical protein
MLLFLSDLIPSDIDLAKAIELIISIGGVPHG